MRVDVDVYDDDGGRTLRHRGAPTSSSTSTGLTTAHTSRGHADVAVARNESCGLRKRTRRSRARSSRGPGPRRALGRSPKVTRGTRHGRKGWRRRPFRTGSDAKPQRCTEDLYSVEGWTRTSADRETPGAKGVHGAPFLYGRG